MVSKRLKRIQFSKEELSAPTVKPTAAEAAAAAATAAAKTAGMQTEAAAKARKSRQGGRRGGNRSGSRWARWARRTQAMEEVEAVETVRQALARAAATEDIDEIIELTRSASPVVRQGALVHMCPCRVQKDLEDFWTRVLEMIDDESVAVRKQVLHTLCDGSPASRELDIIPAIDTFTRDGDREIKRIAGKVMASYRARGVWNIL